jgi:hypothetical protein
MIAVIRSIEDIDYIWNTKSSILYRCDCKACIINITRLNIRHKNNKYLPMKKLLSAMIIISFAASCTKSETQYIDKENKKQSVNNPQSDSIRTLQEVSDTAQINQDRSHKN